MHGSAQRFLEIDQRPFAEASPEVVQLEPFRTRLLQTVHIEERTGLEMVALGGGNAVPRGYSVTVLEIEMTSNNLAVVLGDVQSNRIPPAFEKLQK